LKIDLGIKKEKGFDRHTASAYLIALKGLGMLNGIKWRKTHGLSETVDNGTLTSTYVIFYLVQFLAI
jgi:hypothetical protein